MGNALLPYLEKLLVQIENDVKRFEQKGKDALFLKPYAEWSESDRRRYMRGSTEQRMAESDKWMYRQLDAEWAAKELREIIFLQKLKHDRK